MDAARALQILRTTGRLRLPGAPSPGQVAVRRLLAALTVIVIVLILVCIIGSIGLALVPFVGLGSNRTELVIMFGVIAAILGAVLVVLVVSRRNLRRVRGVARLPVELDARGLTLRGVGPVPWSDFEPARVEMVQKRSDGNYARAVIMPLTRSGMVAVNERLDPALRGRLGEVSGGLLTGGAAHRWIVAPSSADLGERDMIELVNTARAGFLGRRPR